MSNSNKRNPWTWIPTLYFAEGLPNIIVTGLSVVMYMQMGLTDAEVGLFTGWLALPWVIKPLWSPFIDLLKTKRWWVLTMQALIGASLAGIAFAIPTAFWFQATMCLFFIIAFCSATHDISADGFYMIELDEHNQTKFVGLRNTFYRLAIIFVNGFLVMLAGVLQVKFRNQIRFSWALIFYGLAGIFIGLWLYHSRFMPRPEEDTQTDRTVSEVAHELKNMFRTFFEKFSIKETICVMLFLLFYRFPEALLNTMTKTFILRPNSQGGLGMSPQEYGLANGTVGLIGLLLGGVYLLELLAQQRHHHGFDLPLHRAVWLRTGLHRPHALYAILQPGQVQDLPLLHLYRNLLLRLDASGHGVRILKGCFGLPPLFHCRNGMLRHHLLGYSFLKD